MGTEDIEAWMRREGIKRIVKMNEDTGGGWCVYPDGESAFGTGATLAEAAQDARART